MENMPSIILSSLDEARLARLIDSDKAKQLPGIDALHDEIERATVVEPGEVPPDLVTMNSTVRFIDDTSGTEHQFTLVYPHQVRSAETISVLAPVGSALLGLSVGQSIEWQVPGGRKLNLRVLEIVRQPEAMGEYHR